MIAMRTHLAWALILCLSISLAMVPPTAMAQRNSAQTSASEKVNLNTATVEELQAISRLCYAALGFACKR